MEKAVTTIVSLAARDFIVAGCDSLATTSADLIFPHEIVGMFFEASGELKKDTSGNPLLNNASQIWSRATNMPVDQLPSVTKLFDLEPVRACLLFAGTSRIGNTTIRNLVETFKARSDVKQRRKDYTMEWIAQKLASVVQEIYEKEIPEAWMRPLMEIILSGYSANQWEPEVWRLTFDYDRTRDEFKPVIDNSVPRGEYNILFGGQYDVIQRVVRGIDWASYLSLKRRTAKVLSDYHDELLGQVQEIDPKIEIPKPNFRTEEKYNIFGDDSGGVTRIFSDVGSLSEQAGIDFVYFLIDVMIKAQEFQSQIATIGGKIHIALLTKSKKLKMISKEEYTFEHGSVPKD